MVENKTDKTTFDCREKIVANRLTDWTHMLATTQSYN